MTRRWRGQLLGNRKAESQRLGTEGWGMESSNDWGQDGRMMETERQNNGGLGAECWDREASDEGWRVRVTADGEQSGGQEAT